MALYKRGEITAPVFEPPHSEPELSPLLRVIGAMNTHETDSSKRLPLASKAEPVLPMK